MPEPTKKCKFCGEEILQVAIKCKHCGSMQDGSDQEKKVTVSGVDPFAELHTPIKGKSKGKLTFLGKLGIGLGILIIIVGIYVITSSNTDADLQGSFMIILLGVLFAVASFLWARRPTKK